MLLALVALEAIVALVDPGQYQFFVVLSDAMSSIFPAIANISPSTPQGQNARSFISIVFLLLPLKGWFLYRWLVYRQDEAFGYLVVTPRTGKSVGYSIFVLFFLLAIASAVIPEIWFFGPPQPVSGQSPDIAQSVLYSRTMKNGLSMWGVWSIMFAGGISLFLTLVVWSIRDWIVYLREKEKA